MAIIILSQCLPAPAQTEIELAPLKPGPHAIVADWQGQPDIKFSYIWNAITNKAVTSDSRQIINLPAFTLESGLPLLKITTTASLSTSPLILLYSQGDPLRLNKNEAAFLPENYSNNLIYPYQDTTELTLPDLTGAHLLVKIDGNQDRTNQSIILQPLYKTRTCLPTQDGVYLFETYDEKGSPAQNIARRLEGKKASEVVAPQKGFSGQCLQFIPLEVSYASDLDNDALFAFSGFHGRETARGNHPPYQRWTTKPDAGISVTYPPHTAAEIRIELAAHRPENIPMGRVFIEDGTKRHPVEFKNGTWSGRILIPASDKEKISLSIISETWTPAKTINSKDTRELGVMLKELSIRFQR